MTPVVIRAIREPAPSRPRAPNARYAPEAVFAQKVLLPPATGGR
ncbi:hypothetical protein [Nocardiopsis sp. NRRL B-16309]|nr:hypothetical protein [Nocardiopsis sp. NRRL B-16309]